MIYFNNVSLESVAPVKVEDVHVSPIQLSVTARQRPIFGGSDFVRVKEGDRTVQITFALLTNDMQTRQRQLQAITGWARTSAPGKLQIPYFEGYLECLCTSLPEPSLRQWWESRLTVTFQTFGNPYFNAISERTAQCGTQFAVLGNAPPLMRLERILNANTSNQSYSDGESTMTFSTIPAGNMVIDLNKQTAEVDGTSIMQYYTYDSAFIVPKVGAQTITGVGTVVWRERWQ